MATYDLDRWSKQIRKRNQEASLTLHLHPHHCRFEHQNGVFLYDSPIKSLLESIKDARLPVELLDLLDATAVKYYEGCLVVEVVDHRGVVDQETLAANGSASITAGGSSANPRGSIDATDASGIISNSRSGSLTGGIDSRRGSRTIPSARGSDGSHKPTMSLSMNDSNDPNAALFHKRFMISYRRFEAAFQEASSLKINQIAKDKKQEEQKKLRQQQIAEQFKLQDVKSNGQSANSKESSSTPKENQVMENASIHSAIAAAVATATTMDPSTNGDGGKNEEEDALARNKPLVYRITLGPDIETIWTDLVAMREEKRARWTEDDMLAIESRILALTAPPLCLSPDMQVSRIANALLDATSLPITPAIPSRKRDLPLQAIKAQPKSAKKAKTSAAEKEAAEREQEEEAKRAQQDAQESAERLEEEAWQRVMDDSYTTRLSFQPSFSRLAFVHNWREKKTAEEEAARQRAADLAAAQAQAQADAEARAAAAEAAKLASDNNSRQGSVTQSRQGSVIDIPVNAPTPGNNISISRTPKEDLVVGMGQQQQQQQQQVPTQQQQQPAPIKKKKLNKNKDKAAGRAGSPSNANTSVTDLTASTNSNGPTSLKLTLPAKNKKNKDKGASKSGSPDIIVNPSPPPSSIGTPVNVNHISATTVPTAAQQAIMRKTANLPKAKLKSDIKAQAQAQALALQQQQQQQAQNMGTPQNSQMMGSPASQQGTPQMQGPQQQQQQQMNQQPIRPSSTNPQMNLPIQPQRNFVSPVQNHQQMQGQFSSPQSQGLQLPGVPPGPPYDVAQTQEYMNQLQAQITQYQQSSTQQQQQLQPFPQQQQQSQLQGGRQMSFNNLAGSPFPQQNMQVPNQRPMSQNQFPTGPPQGTQTGPTPQNFAGNIHRSPIYNNATLPGQQQQSAGLQTPQPQHQFNPFNNNASPSNMGGIPQATQFTPQQAYQLQQLQQQQQQQQSMLSQHTQSLANFGSQNNNMQPNFNMNAYNAQQAQQQMPFGQQAMQNLQNMPNINMQIPQQFNPAMLNQLQRAQQQQQQQQQSMMQGYGNMQNQWQGQ